MNEVEIRLSDDWGRDSIILVEGDAEANCFGLCLSPDERKNVEFVGLINVGQITTKRAAPKAIVDIYEKHSSTSAIIPQTVYLGLKRRLETVRREKFGPLSHCRCNARILPHWWAIPEVRPYRHPFGDRGSGSERGWRRSLRTRN
jgi:hypothetical protein